jgi:hypothetical protein
VGLARKVNLTRSTFDNFEGSKYMRHKKHTKKYSHIVFTDDKNRDRYYQTEYTLSDYDTYKIITRLAETDMEDYKW